MDSLKWELQKGGEKAFSRKSGSIGIRVEYFILKPAAEETFEQGLSVLFEEKAARLTGFK